MPVPSLLLIHGDETHLVDKAVREWHEAAKIQSGAPDFSIELFDSPPKIGSLKISLQTPPFLYEEGFILLRDPLQLTNTVRKGSDGAEALLEAISKKLPENFLCIVVHRKVAPANLVLTNLPKLGGHIIVCNPVKGREIYDWINRECSSRAIELPSGAAQHLVNFTAGNLGMLDNELQKIADFSQGRPITMDDLKALTSGNEAVAVWDVLERLCQTPHAQGAEAIQMLLSDGVAPMYIIITLAGQIRDLLMAKQIMKKGRIAPSTLAATLKLPPWRGEKIVRQAGSLSDAQLVDWLHALQRLDVGIKSGEIDDAQGLRAFGLRAASSFTMSAGAT